MKMGPDARDTAKNEFGSEKLENKTRHPLYRGKRLRAKHENGT
jgi:hypothetical protein